MTEEVKGASTWLANGRSPFPKVVSQWILTAPLRFNHLFLHSGEAYVNNYIEDWPVLGHKSGHELVSFQ